MNIIVPFIGGLGMFIYGMQIMAQGLENVAGNRMKSLLKILTKNKFLGAMLGALITAVIQSSSATTVMIVGFVNAGIMNLSQAMGVIMGANIGTTVTGWLVSSVEWAKYLSPAMLAPVAIMLGVIIMLTKKGNAAKEVSGIIIGFGLLFVGITTMSAAVSPLKESEAFRSIFVTLGSSPLLAVAAGALVTAVIQSSSASVGILQSLAAAGLVPFNAAVYIIMGQNIGTCVTAVISGVGAKRTAKTAGYMHLLFNIIGTVIFGTAVIIYMHAVNPAWAYGGITQTQISLIHTIFNICTTILLFPVSDWIIKLAMKIGRVEKEEQDEGQVLLDERMLEITEVAFHAVTSEIIRMSKMVEKNLELACQILFTPDRGKIEEIKDEERKVDRMTDGISKYIVKLSLRRIGEREHKEAAHMMQAISDMERISDHCENIAEFAEQMLDKKIAFTGKAKESLEKISSLSMQSYQNAVKAFISKDKAYILKTIDAEDEIDRLEIDFRSENIERMTNQQYGTQAGIIFQDTMLNMERISDHARNIAEERKDVG